MSKEEEKKYQTLKTQLYLEDLGSIDLDAQLHTHSDAEIQITIWSSNSKKLWEGTAIEFWALILFGLETKKLMSICPKCGGTNKNHAPNCPIVQLAKKEVPEDARKD